MLTVGTGVVAATVTLSEGNDGAVNRIAKRPSQDGVLLFGSSDLLLLTRVTGFDTSKIHFDDVARSANWHYALALQTLHPFTGRVLPFRGLTFLRLHRPKFERPTAPGLEAILDALRSICARHEVAAEALLGYGWADLYLDLRAERLESLFAAVAECRGLALDQHSVFRNAFSIVGVDLKFQKQAAASTETVWPSIALRVAPSDLTRVANHEIPVLFPRTLWQWEITTGKRDVVIQSVKPIPFADFLKVHRKLRSLIGASDSPIYKVETHLQFPPQAIAPSSQPATLTPKSCPCRKDGRKAHKVFERALAACDDSIGAGLKQSFAGLAHLYREALEDRDSCCDFDAAAAHFFEQHRLLTEYGQIARTLPKPKPSTAYTTIEQEALNRRELLRQAFERLDISSMIIFQQEQNGSYADLLTRSERVSLFRGGLQKINTVLLTAIDALRERFALTTTPMLCWWPAGKIQSERPIGVIKVPVFFLHQPETALFLIMHELGQLSAYEYFDDLRRNQLTPVLEDPAGVLHSLGISLEGPGAPATEDLYAMLEDLLRDLGVLITDMFADSYLLAVGFSDHFRRMGTFLFEQFLRLEETAEPESLSAFKLTVSLFARLLAMAIAKNRRASCISSDVPIAQSELRQARGDVTHFLTHAVYHPRFASLLTERRKRVRITVRDVVVEREAIRLVTMAERAIRMASDFSARFTGPASLSKADPPNAAAIERGEVTEIERTRITDYFGRLLDIEDSDERLFRARAALVASVLISCEPRRRLAHFRED